jgi:hypothetical protein
MVVKRSLGGGGLVIVFRKNLQAMLVHSRVTIEILGWRSTMRVIAAIICVVLSSVPRAAIAADGPILDFTGGISSLASGACCGPTTGTIPIGWYGGVGVPVYRWLSVVGEVSGDYETWRGTSPVPSLVFPSIADRTYAVMGGPRLAKTPTPRVLLFGQLLLGMAHRAWTVRESALRFETSSAINQFALQPGGGIEFVLAGPWSVRVEGDYRITPLGGLSDSRIAITQPRFTSGLVFRR